MSPKLREALGACPIEVNRALLATETLSISPGSRLSQDQYQLPPLRQPPQAESFASSQQTIWTSDITMNPQVIGSLAPTGCFMPHSQQLSSFGSSQSTFPPSQAGQTPAHSVGLSASENVAAVLEPSVASDVSDVDRAYDSQFVLDSFGNPRYNHAT